MIRKAKGDQPIVTPSWWKLKYRSVAEKLILIFDPVIMEKFAALAGYDPGKKRVMMQQRYYPPPDTGRAGLIGPAVGSANAGNLLEVLATLGARSVLGYGICGSIRPELSIGRVFVPTKAHSEEGLSRHYYPKERVFETSAPLREILEQKLREASIDFATSPIWTTDAIFRETADKVVHHAEQGAWAVDMETSALCAVAKYRQVQYAAMMIVSDELGSLAWKPGFAFPGYKKSMKAGLQVLADLRF